MPGTVSTSTSSKCMGWRRWSTFPTTSGRCWCSVPPKKTFSTWQPRQMASTGRSASSAAARRARSLASRFGSTPPTSGSGLLPVGGRVHVATPGQDQAVEHGDHLGRPRLGAAGGGAGRRQEQGPAAGGGHQLEIGRGQDGGPALPRSPGHVGHIGRDADERKHRSSVPMRVALDGRRERGQHGACPDQDQDVSSSMPPSPTGRSTPSCVAFPDMHGRPVGKRVTADFFTVARGRARDRGVRLPPGGGRRHEPAARLPLHQLGHRLRRLRLPARLRHGPPDPVARRHRLRHLRPDRRGRGAGRGVAPPDPAPPVGAGGRARPAGVQRDRARVLPLQGLLRGGRRQGVEGPDAARLDH